MRISEIQKGVKIIDELLVLFELYKEDYHIIQEALEVIAKARHNNPQFPITMSLAGYMRERGLIE